MEKSQKGTCGALLPSESMPFTSSGLQPDIIINPCCMPSRMTVGQLIEHVFAKAAVLSGQHYDGTPFRNLDVDAANKILRENGFLDNGKEELYNGYTGEKMEARIFMCPGFYLRLKHLTDDKIHSRSRGPNTQLTRQPTEGRGRDGGLRFGEMERDSIIGHGAAQNLKEIMVDRSDMYGIHVCNKCGLFAQKMPNKNVYFCNACKNYTDINKIKIPYGFKLFVQELMSMNILPRLRVERNDYTDTV